MPEFIDLSGYIEEGQPVYPGHDNTQILPTATHEETGYVASQRLDERSESVDRHLSAQSDGDDTKTDLVRSILVSEHGPTHVDAPVHLTPTSDQTIDDVPLDRFYGDAVCVDLSDVSPDDVIGPDDVRAALDDAGLELGTDDTLLVRTGHYDEHYATDDVESKYQFIYHYTGLTPESTEWVAERGADSIGIDTPSLDPHPAALDDVSYPAHGVCAEHDILILENITNLERVAGRRFTICFFPLKLRDGTGSPIRPVAILE